MPPLEVYEGDLPYIFVAYAHADRDAALPMVAALVAEGYRVWYDDGIEPAVDYPEYIADHIHGCSCFVMLVSRTSLRSEWCRREAGYAFQLGKIFLPVYLEPVELSRGFQMLMGHIQALFWYRYDSDEEFYRRLFETRRLDRCLTEEGRKRRGIKVAILEVLNALRAGGKRLELPETYQSDRFGDYSFIEFKAIQETTASESRADR